ncbi:glycoside hydrolase family 9 protein [Fibrobacter sp.]|uniref:glycoside hydrolase family 9 protein n=1 Tax=Fibrobacter sp. TaxID=35828 RepID=UPI00388D1369
MENEKESIRIRYNHVGYGVDFSKTFFVAVLEGGNEHAFEGGIFELVDSLGKPVFTDKLSYCGKAEYTGEILYVGNFTEYRHPGKYRIRVGNQESHLFEISDEWISRQFKSNVKSFYYQRTGEELDKALAGKWARPASHMDDKLEFHPTMNRKGVWNAHGGWYDAGDYGKYIVNGGVSVATLMLACEMKHSLEVVDGVDFVPSFEQPFSLLDEIRFELEFFLRMQDDDGGVFFKVTPGHWDGFMMPADSDVMQKRFILGKSTTSTLNFAGALAQAHRVFAATDPQFATRCLAASRRAYQWALDNPSVEWPHNTEGSGGYGDEHVEDEFFWARAMLYRETCDETLLEKLPHDMEMNPPKLGLDWRDTQNLGWIALALGPLPPCAQELQKTARNALEKTADEILRLQRDDPYGISLRRFIWGSNGIIANHALTSAIVYSWSKNREYLDSAFEQMNFIYGRNPVDVSFVTGSAWSSPMHPHHRICHSDGVEEPIPGLLVGGLNNDRQDMIRKPHYPGDLPGFAYTDERCSFASNETAINWNAPLTSLLALLNQP